LFFAAHKLVNITYADSRGIIANQTKPNQTKGQPMTTFFISRHPGAIEWIKHQDQPIDRFVAHVSLVDISPGDTVKGTLPIPLVAALTSTGARNSHLSIEVPASMRGKELSSADLRALGACLQAFCVLPQ
jgi:CRISPR-associated protein Csx16